MLLSIKFKRPSFMATFMFSLWTGAGYLTYLAAQYNDLNIINVRYYLAFLDKVHVIFITEFAKFFLYHSYFMLSSLVFAFTFPVLLSCLTKFKLVWLVGFFVGATCFDFISFYSEFLSYSEVYETLPANLVSGMRADIVRLMFVLPLFIYLGASLGRKINRFASRKLGGREMPDCFPIIKDKP